MKTKTKNYFFENRLKKKLKDIFYRLEAKFPNFHGKVKTIKKILIIVLNYDVSANDSL